MLRLKILRRGLSIWDLGFSRNKRNERTGEFPSRKPQQAKNQDHFCCTIRCGYGGKRRHYEDECRIKRRESEKLKKAEEERRRNAGKGGKPEGGGPNPEGSKCKGNARAGRRSLAPPTGGREAPNPTPKGEHSGEKRPVPSTLSAGGADKGSENAKKRLLNSHAKCLQAAGFEVNFPEEG